MPFAGLDETFQSVAAGATALESRELDAFTEEATELLDSHLSYLADTSFPTDGAGEDDEDTTLTGLESSVRETGLETSFCEPVPKFAELLTTTT